MFLIIFVEKCRNVLILREFPWSHNHENLEGLTITKPNSCLMDMLLLLLPLFFIQDSVMLHKPLWRASNFPENLCFHLWRVLQGPPSFCSSTRGDHTTKNKKPQRCNMNVMLRNWICSATNQDSKLWIKRSLIGFLLILQPLGYKLKVFVLYGWAGS